MQPIPTNKLKNDELVQISLFKKSKYKSWNSKKHVLKFINTMVWISRLVELIWPARRSMTAQQVPRSFNSDPQHSWIYGLYVHLWQHASSSFGCIGKRFSNVIISFFPPNATKKHRANSWAVESKMFWRHFSLKWPDRSPCRRLMRCKSGVIWNWIVWIGIQSLDSRLPSSY